MKTLFTILTLLGIMTEGQNQKASEFFTQLRQERQE